MANGAFLKLSDRQLLALALYGEARGEITEGKIAVGSVILERVKLNKWYGQGLQGVILKPWQFSCFNESDPNYRKLLHIAEQWDEEMALNSALNDCYGIAAGLLDGTISPNVTATHYHTVQADSKWDDRMTLVATIGRHEFFI